MPTLTSDTRKPLDLTGATISTGRAFAVNAEGVIIEIDAPHSQIVTWRGNHAAEDASQPQKA